MPKRGLEDDGGSKAKRRKADPVSSPEADMGTSGGAGAGTEMNVKETGMQLWNTIWGATDKE
jgi:hypothetical protein